MTFEESNRPSQWLVEARGQLRTGNLLCDHLLSLRLAPPPDTVEELAWQVALFSAMLLHWGYAVEAAAKAVLIAKDPSSLNQRFFKTHNLRLFVEKAGEGHPIPYPISDLLERLTEYVVWAGRYPVPLASERLAEAEGRLMARPNLDRRYVAGLIDDLANLVPDSDRS